jgi:hypothetical protein
VVQSVSVNAVDTLINPEQAGSVNQIGSDTIQNRLSSLPGRSLQDPVNSQPGWLYHLLYSERDGQSRMIVHAENRTSVVFAY